MIIPSGQICHLFKLQGNILCTSNCKTGVALKSVTSNIKQCIGC